MPIDMSIGAHCTAARHLRLTVLAGSVSLVCVIPEVECLRCRGYRASYLAGGSVAPEGAVQV